jgi:fucose 4-O-acetylase-like acetyltransferase
MLKERLNWVDSLKFIGIFYIYLGHFETSAGHLYPFVFSFHVPLFFFISGLFAKKTLSINDFSKTATIAFKKIIIPYAAFSIIALVVMSIHGNWTLEHTINNGIKAIYGIRNNIYAGSLWFLPCLFIVILYHSLLSLLLRNKFIVLIVSFAIYLTASSYSIISNPSWFFNADSALCYLVYYSLGNCLAMTLLQNPKEYSHENKIIFFLMTILSSIFAALCFFKGSDFYFSQFSSPQVRLAFSFAVTSILFIPNIYLASLINWKAISILGQATLVLCGTEQILKLIISSAFESIGLKITLANPLDAILYTSLCFIVSYFTIVRAYNHLTK